MLREHAGVFGRTANYTVYDQADVRRVIEWLLSDQQRGQIQQALADYGQPAASEVLPRSRWPRTGCSPPTATSRRPGTRPRR